MEIVTRDDYKMVLKDEVPVFLQPMEELFLNNRIYVFGYGSLLTESGWRRRNMVYAPKHKDLIECELKGFERGPWGVFGRVNYYGVIRSARKRCNGVLAPIRTLRDWVNLMRTEQAAGLTANVNYRVVDVTDSICHVADAHKLEKPYRVHCVCNRPINRQKALCSAPAAGYYSYVWRCINNERSMDFVENFTKLGGFENGYDVAKFLDKEVGCDE